MGCPVCFSERVVAIETYSSPGYAFNACQDCGVIFADPMKAGTKEWYENHAFYAAPGEPKDNKPFYEEQFLTQALRSGQNRLLNIGCGYNQFLRKLENAGYEVTGVDLNEQLIRFTKEKLGIKEAYAVSVDDFIAGYSKDKFDFIIFFEVLEHLVNPGEFLLSLKKILSPKGRIVFSMPNCQRFLPQTHWADYPPHHLTRWNRQTVRRALEKNGFIIEKSLISPVSAEQLFYALGFDFWTGQLGKDTDDGKKPMLLSGIYRFLFKIRVIFYNLLAIGLKPFFSGKGTYLYTVATLNKTNETCP